ncbi:hypothetical protein OQZ33_04435 [Pedobacter sp. MC2016-05]|uniref:hypothetical protein n=1 Tax=Pedobacter sp. MC2016-05 TaxID=2994474 RepID=UPI0022480DEB|nr:hypothetical protein [Pedobacter sp. MC2016-05]MCX2473574.1 hypothetical protein [Pedobacter sp. MC2016-05]
MNIIQIENKSYTCPDKWTEMEAWQLLIWMKIISRNIERTHAFAFAVMLFYKIKKRTFFKLNAAQQVQLKNTLQFLAEGNKLFKWVIPIVKPFFWIKHFGPSDRLATSTIQEFRFAETYYLAFQKTQNQAFIDQLIAALYREKGFNNLKMDCRVQISQLLINTTAGKMKRLDKATRAAIVFNYEGCREYIFHKYPTIFKKSVNQTKSNSLPDLEGIIKTVAGGKFGTFRETEDTSLYIFLDHLADEIEAAEKANRK